MAEDRRLLGVAISLRLRLRNPLQDSVCGFTGFWLLNTLGAQGMGKESHLL